MPQTGPDISPRCLKCGSDAMIPDVRVVDRGQNNYRHESELGLQARPDAILFKHEVRVGTWAQVCGDCGFVEMYAADPPALWDAHIDRLANDLD